MTDRMYEDPEDEIVSLALTVEGLRSENAQLRRQVEGLEQLRPMWAQGWTSDSAAAQAASTALSSVWKALGVDDQTAAMAKLNSLISAQPQTAPVTRNAAALAERLIQAAVDYEAGRCSKREMAEARAAVEAAIQQPTAVVTDWEDVEQRNNVTCKCCGEKLWACRNCDPDTDEQRMPR